MVESRDLVMMPFQACAANKTTSPDFESVRFLLLATLYRGELADVNLVSSSAGLALSGHGLRSSSRPRAHHPVSFALGCRGVGVKLVCQSGKDIAAAR